MAVRRGGLREAARIKRVHVGYESTTGWAKYDIESLAYSSAAIIIGKPLSSSSSLAASGETIITEHKVRVERVLFGDLRRMAPLPLRVGDRTTEILPTANFFITKVCVGKVPVTTFS